VLVDVALVAGFAAVVAAVVALAVEAGQGVLERHGFEETVMWHEKVV